MQSKSISWWYIKTEKYENVWIFSETKHQKPRTYIQFFQFILLVFLVIEKKYCVNNLAVARQKAVDESLPKIKWIFHLIVNLHWIFVWWCCCCILFWFFFFESTIYTWKIASTSTWMWIVYASPCTVHP